MEKNNNIEIREISIVVLCYKAGRFVETFVNKIVSMLEKEQLDYELVLVGNYYPGTGDITPDIVTSIAAKNGRVRAVTEPKKGRMGWDMRLGLSMANGRYIAVIDGDGQMPYQDILKVYRMIKNGDFDLCKTYRIERFDSFYRKLISIVYNIIFAIVFSSRAKDVNSKPKIITREAYGKLKLVSDDWFLDAEIMIQAGRLGFRIGQIPTVFEKNKNRHSFVRMHTIMEFIKNIIVYRLKEFISGRCRS